MRVAVVGDFCLDRYLEIDPTKQETSIETALPVHNVVNVLWLKREGDIFTVLCAGYFNLYYRTTGQFRVHFVRS